MATNDRVIKQICEEFAPAGVTCKKMFGEYGLFVAGKVFALVCDDTLFVKPTPSAQMMLEGARCAPPYAGAKPMPVLDDWSNSGFLCELVAAVKDELPAPKNRKRS